MKKNTTLATHYIKNENVIGFSAEDYSKFKFGKSDIGNKFGNDLFQKLITSKKVELNDYKKIVIFSSPYDFIPTATQTIFLSFFNSLSDYFKDSIKIEKNKIHRNTTYTDDYGNLSKEDRMKLISNDSFEIENNFDGTELLIFLDDIKITGSHEFVVKKTLKEKQIVNDVMFLYHALLINNEIDPTFENYLNYKYVKNVSQLVEIHNSSDFAINTRFTKFILQLNESDFNYFTENVNDESLKKIAFNAFGNKYDKIPKYIGNLKKIINLAKIEFIKHLNL